MTAIVHGEAAARAAGEAADVLFGGDPLAASPAALATLAGEVPSSTGTREQLGDVVGLLTSTGLAASNSDARRQLQQGRVQVNGVKIGPDQGLDGDPAAARPLAAAAQGQAVVPPGRDFSGPEVDAPTPRR